MKPLRLLSLATAVLLSAALSAACTEDLLSGVDPDSAPGGGSATIEIELGSAELSTWLDTTFVGYALPSAAGILLASSGSDLESRILGRFVTLPDSVVANDGRREVEEFASASFRLIVDSAATTLPDSGALLSAYALQQGFVGREATWTEAAEGTPWATPGGDLGELLGTVRIDSVVTSRDTLFLTVDVSADSLLRAWREAGGEPGFAVVTETDGASVTLASVALRAEAKPVGADTLIEVIRAPSPVTFIFDPETPPPTSALRLGGLPAARAYLRFVLPESVGGQKLRGARINRATLVLTSTGPPPAPFATGDTLFASVFTLLSDPFESGPKTPVGATFGNFVEIVPEDQVDGAQQDINVTLLLQAWAAADPTESPDLRLGIRALPEGAGLGFWEFGSVEDVSRAPRLRIVLTPDTQFDLP